LIANNYIQVPGERSKNAIPAIESFPGAAKAKNWNR